jgi:hypothetical protein
VCVGGGTFGYFLFRLLSASVTFCLGYFITADPAHLEPAVQLEPEGVAQPHVASDSDTEGQADAPRECHEQPVEMHVPGSSDFVFRILN